MSTVIVGGGITGLAAAWKLSGGAEPVTLIEEGPCGGLMRTEHVEGCTVECGADSWIAAKPFLRDLAGELGLADQVITANPANRGTYIFRAGKLLPYPRGVRMVAPTKWWPILASPLLGWATKFRMARELSQRPRELPDRSVAEFVRDHFGEEAVEYMAEPLFSGVYGGSPERLSVQTVLPKLVEHERRVGSVIRGARRERGAESGPVFESLRDGLGALPLALFRKMAGRVRFIETWADRVEPGRVRVNGDWLPAPRILLACGAPAAARLLAETTAGDLLGRIAHSSATIFALAFRRGDLRSEPRGFGFLVPRRERQAIFAGTWVTNKFAGRAPDGVVLLRCFASGDHGESMLPEVRRDLARIADIDAEPLFTRVYRWPDSLPQYDVGHQGLVNRIRAAFPANIHMAGAFAGAVGMPDCARSGAEAAENL